MNKNMIILIGILLLWLLVIRPLSKSSGNTQELPENEVNAENETLTFKTNKFSPYAIVYTEYNGDNIDTL